MAKTNNENEKELIRKAQIAARVIGYRSLREYEFAMYRKAIEQAENIGKPTRAKAQAASASA